MENETLKIIRQRDGKINIVNKDGLGVLLNDEADLSAWLASSEPDAQWVEDLKDIAGKAQAIYPKLRGIEQVDVQITRKEIVVL